MPEIPKPQIAVVILNWNGLPLLKRFLKEVVEHSHPLGTVYVIDNHSEDDSLEWLKLHHPGVSLIALEENYGYAGGYNRGLARIHEPYAVLLNSDVSVTENWLEPLWQRMLGTEGLVALQPKILDLSNPHYFEYAGACGGFMDQLCYPFCRGRIFEDLEKDEGQYNRYMPVFWASGASLMLNLKVFKDTRGFNEDLFAHMEEIDLCWRLQQKGYEIGCEPASVVFHLGGGTLDKLSPRKTFLNFRNSLIIMYLNLPLREAFPKIFSRLILDLVAAIRFLLQGKVAHVLAILKAHFDFYGQFYRLSHQKKSSGQKSLHSLKGVYQGSIVWQHYIRSKKKFSSLF